MQTIEIVPEITSIPSGFWPTVLSDLDHQLLEEKIFAVDQLPTYEEVWRLHENYRRREFAAADDNRLDYLWGVYFPDSYLPGAEREDSVNTSWNWDVRMSFHNKCHRRGMYLIPNQEFVSNLAAYLISLNISGPVVEVGAGWGKLSYWLREYGIDIIPTDNNPLTDQIKPLAAFQVGDKYKPEVVITSWMDGGYILRQQMEASSVRYLIDISEGPGGIFGHGIKRDGRGVVDQLFNQEGSSKLAYHSESNRYCGPYQRLANLSSYATGWTDDYALPHLEKTGSRFLSKGKWVPRPGERIQRTHVWLFEKAA